MVTNSSGKSPFEIRDSTGKEFKEIYDNQGRLLFKNWNEIQGSPPITFRGYGKNLTECRIYGNTVQNGTPSPEVPVDVVACGVRTGNLFDISTAVLGKYINAQGAEANSTIQDPIGALNHTDYIEIQPNTYYTYHYKYGAGVDNKIALCWFDANKNLISRNTKDLHRAEKEYTLTGTSPANAAFCIINFTGYLPNESMKLSFNTGSTDLPYEPYGYKIPVTVSNDANSVTTPVYVGSEPLHKIGDYADYVDYKRGVVVRRIKKLVLTGEENWGIDGGKAGVYSATNASLGIPVPIQSYVYQLSSHFALADNYNTIYYNTGYFAILTPRLIISYFAKSSVDRFKSYLAAQYAAGTPVTVWYVLIEPEEEPLENLLPIQTIKGSVVLTVSTSVQPSNIWIKGKIKAID